MSNSTFADPRTVISARLESIDQASAESFAKLQTEADFVWWLMNKRVVGVEWHILSDLTETEGLVFTMEDGTQFGPVPFSTRLHVPEWLDEAPEQYGPQTAEVIAILRRETRLTIPECCELELVADQVEFHKRLRVVPRLYNFPYRLQGSRAWEVTGVLKAVGARHLLDDATEWNQEAYDLLTGPWRKVIGPVHADDEEVAR